MPEPHAQISELFRAVSRELHDHFRAAFRGCDIPFGAMMLLRHVRAEPGVTVSEVARRSGTVKSHVSKTIDQMCRQGYLEKRPDPSDQRLLRLHLTAATEQLIAGMEARAKAMWADLVGEVPAERVNDVIRGLQVLLAALEKKKGKGSKE